LPSFWTSWLNDHNLFNEFNVVINGEGDPRTLDVTYTLPGTVIHKYVEVTAEYVKVTFQSEKEFRAHLEIWRWVMT
jgi:hypothetical protein